MTQEFMDDSKVPIAAILDIGSTPEHPCIEVHRAARVLIIRMGTVTV